MSKQRTSLEGGSDAQGAVAEAPTGASSSSSANADSAADGHAKKKRRSSSGCDPDAKQEELPIHVIHRTMPLKMRCADPAQCIDMIDRMYNVYYELEVRLVHMASLHTAIPIASLTSICFTLISQEKFSAKPYMKNQKDINQKMRSILIDWLVEVHNKFKLQPQTLWLCVNILDRYLEQVQTMRSKLQLVGVTALLIACKYEEIYPPEVKDCVYITDYAYDRAEVLSMETAILSKLEYKISIPTGYHFLIRYLNAIQASERTRNIASYYAERNLQESDMLLVRPHKFAAAALYAALKQQNDQYPSVLGRAQVWTKVLQEESGLYEKDLKECSRIILKHVGEEPETASKRRLVATKKKYAADKYNNISGLALPTV